MSVEIICGDARTVLETLPAQSVHTCVTSPPYWHQRDYGCSGQIGLESAPADYIAVLVEVFSAVHRVLRDDGTCWIVIGDSYAGSWGNQGRKDERGTQRPINGAMLQPCDDRYPAHEHNTGAVPVGFKPKDLMMLPHRLAIELQDAGWYVRNDCVWAKGSAMPESVQDRFSRAHEYVFHLAKSERYYFDPIAVAERAAEPERERHERIGGATGHLVRHSQGGMMGASTTRHRRSVLHVNPQPFSAARYGVKDIDHYAVFPEKLVEICVLASTSDAGCCAQCGAPWQRVVERHKAGQVRPYHSTAGRHPRREVSPGAMDCSERTTLNWVTASQTVGWQASCSCAAPVAPCGVLDPFAGSGTVGLVAKRLGRSATLIDLNPSYCHLAEQRLNSVPYTLFSAAASTEGAAR